ncbi:ATP-dependent DNA ligase [Streptomyces sp. NPDC054834]
MSHGTRQSLEKDGYRAQLAVHADRRVLLRSRQGTDMTSSFPEIRTAALAQLPADTGLDGELVVWEQGRLAFERLQQRLARRGARCTRPGGW